MNNSKSKNKAHQKVNINSYKKYNKLNHRLIKVKVKVHLHKIYNKMSLK